ncbi:hypothetical protein HispidOSU_016298 [Sigmodon hispidus]
MEESPTKETSATPTMETLSSTESGISTGLSDAEGTSACCESLPRLTWVGRLELEKEFSMRYSKEETSLAERWGMEAEANAVRFPSLRMQGWKGPEYSPRIYSKCLMLSPFNSLEDSRNEILRRRREERINRRIKRWQKYYRCNGCCQTAFPGPEKSSQNTNTNPDSDLGEALKDLKKLQLSPGYHQNPDDLWKDLEAFEKLQLSPGCQSTGDTSQNF